MKTPKRPYLRLRWAPGHGPGNWLCHYELVLPLDEDDIRRTDIKEGKVVRRRKRLIVPMSGPTRRSSNGVPCVRHDGTLYCDTPIRDGKHAEWDAAKLGGLDVYVIALNRKRIKLEV